jgi:thioredoxin reductase
VLLAIGRRGSPRKLNIPGEDLEKVAYRLLDPEIISGKEIAVIGGGDSAIESAILLSCNNKVILSYRGDAFSRIKPGNKEKIEGAVKAGLIDVRLNTNVVAIEKDEIILASGGENGEKVRIKNDLVYIFAGGELPTQFLLKIGLQVTKKFGEAVLKHR